jgi:outer membrane protein OmpA-like peptidoglycan-associated protein
MTAARLLSVSLLLGVLTSLAGCALVPKTQLTECQLQGQALAEQCREQLAEIERLRDHSRKTEDRLIRTEEELALLEEQVGLDQRQLANYQRERAELHGQFLGLANGRAQVSSQVSDRMAELSRRCPNLQFDPATGISKLDTDVLFDTGRAELTPAAEQMLAELVRMLKSPEADGLKIMVAGHTDNRWIAAGTAQDEYSNNFRLSTARALAVADRLRQAGLPEHRMAVAGFGPHQPIAPNVSPADRQKNRRVEIFVMNSDVPVVGWTDSIPSVY